MALTFRDTKGSPLTSAEADANIRQLAASMVPNVSFLAKSTASPVVANASFTRVIFDSLVRQSGQGTQGYDVATSRYVVPVAGCYDVRAVIEFQPTNNTGGVFYLMIFVNGLRRQDLSIGAAPSASEVYGANGSQEIDLLAGDLVEMQTWNDTGGGTLQASGAPYRSAFCMRLITY